MLQQQIEHAINREIQAMRALSGGMIAQVYQVDFSDGQSVVVKADNSHSASLDIEAKMLNYLAERSDLPVPQVIHSEANLLIMEYIENRGSLTSSVQKDAAHHLAALHNTPSDTFGLSFDTLIGSLHRPNTQDDSWIDFFREQRLLYMAQVAFDAGQLSADLRHRIEQFAARLDDFIDEPEQASLIHGDMWGGNVLAHNDKIAAFIDPAIYYAHPEIELAFSTLFGTFGQAFFDVYQELRPIESDFFEERKHIYNLYPLLVHVRLFGGSYTHQVDNVLRKFSA